MATQKFSLNGALTFGWRIMKRHFWFFIGIFIITILLEIIPNVLAGIVAEQVPTLSLLINLAAGIIGMIAGMGVFKIALKFCDDEPIEIADLFSCAPLFMKYLLGSILYGLIVAAGLILLIIPGLIWAVKFQFFSYCIIDKKLGPIEALKASSRMTRGVKWDLFVFGVVLMLMNSVGFLCLGLAPLAPILALFTTAYRIVQIGLLCVGLGLVLAMIPTTLVAYAFVYRSLQDPEYAATNEFAQIPTSGCLKWVATIVVLGFFGLFVLGIIASIAIPNLFIAIQRSKVSRTKADMMAFGTALGAYHVDHNFYPQATTEEIFHLLEKKGYYAGSTRDGWKMDYIYIVAGRDDYRLISYGKDTRPGGSGFDADIIYSDGEFLPPEGATRDEELRSTTQEKGTLRKENMVPTPSSPIPSEAGIRPPIRLRSEPLIVPTDEFKEVFKLDKYGRPREYIRNDFEDRGEVVVDQATGLMWQKSGSSLYRPLRYEDAWEYIQKLNRQSFAGYDDWRLPTMPELMSLLEPEKQSNELYISPIFDARKKRFWSLDTSSSGKEVWYVDFVRGNVNWSYAVFGHHARAVRYNLIRNEELRSTAQERATLRKESVIPTPTPTIQPETEIRPPIRLRSEPLTVPDGSSTQEVFKLDKYGRPREYIRNNFEDRGEVVVDHATRLMWQKSGADEGLTYEQAQAYIQQLNDERFAGHDNWRLPTIPELMSLLEPEERSDELYIGPIFDAKQYWCWSADRGRNGWVWLVHFGLNNTNPGFGGYSHVRAVRSRQ